MDNRFKVISMIAITIFALAVVLIKVVPIDNPKRCDCSGGTVFVISPEDQLKINRKADELLLQGDSVTGYLLKRVLMQQQ